MIKVVSFSGGRTSGLMLRRMLDSGEDFITCFENTGKEREETLQFVHEVERSWRVPIVWLEYTRANASPSIAKLMPTPLRQKNVWKQFAKKRNNPLV